jgi:hypothetical protein
MSLTVNMFGHSNAFHGLFIFTCREVNVLDNALYQHAHIHDL